MLTIKLVEHNGHEQIVDNIETVTADKTENSEYKVLAYPKEGTIIQFGNYGVVYVMNEAGATVSKYWLGYGESPTSD